MIISDLDMPQMTGTEFLDIVRKRFPQMPVIVITGAAPDEVPESLAADAYFHKNGFGLRELLLTILALSRKPPLRTAPPQIDNKPVQARWDGDGHYIMAAKTACVCLVSPAPLTSDEMKRGLSACTAGK
jgi:DNA-binding NtrC family response regulator